MAGNVKKVTVSIDEDTSVEKVASELRKRGMTEVATLTNIATIVGEWSGSLEEIKSVAGVLDVEEQKDRYYPS